MVCEVTEGHRLRMGYATAVQARVTTFPSAQNKGTASGMTRARIPSELKVPTGARGTGSALVFAGRQQAHNPSQVLPCCLVQGRVCAYQLADHDPRGDVERALRRRSHSERDRALRAETDPPGRRLLAGPDSYGLAEHIDRNGFLARLELSITAQTIQIFQRSRPGCGCWRLDRAPATVCQNKILSPHPGEPQVYREMRWAARNQPVL